MTIQDYGSIGEVVGALATVATLAYLAVQIRAHTRMVRAQTRHVSHQLNALANAPAAQSLQGAGVFRRGLLDLQTLEPDEQMQFTVIIAQYFVNLENSYRDFLLGVLSAADFEREWLGPSLVLNTPGARAVWEAIAPGYSEDFRAFLQSKLLLPEARPPSAA